MKRLVSSLSHQLNKYKNFILPKLEIIHLESTNFCNLECRCCQRKELMTRKKQHLEYTLARRIIDQATRIGVKTIYLHMWGEPLMNPGLEDIVAYAVLKGIPFVKVTSNGALLTPERSMSIINSGLSELTISFIGNAPGNYERLMKGAHFDQVTGNINNFLSLRRSLKRETPLLRIQTVLMDSTVGELKEFYEYWKGRVNSFQLNYIEQPYPVPADFSEGLTQLKRRVDEKNRLTCATPFNVMTILVDGSIISSCCVDINGEFILGNAGKDDLDAVWHCAEYNRIRKNILKKQYHKVPVCRDCESSFKEIVRFREQKVSEHRRQQLNIRN